MNLVRAEFSRLFARRTTVVMVLVIAALLALIAMGFGLSSSKPTPAELDRARVTAAAAQATWDENRRECLDVARGVITAPTDHRYPPNCDYGERPTADQFLNYGFSFRREWEALYYTAAIILTLFGFVIGASFVGAEWTSGGMTNLLLWRPQRLTVLGTKLGVVLGGVLALAVGYLVAWTLAFLGVATTSGVIGEMDAAEISSLLLAFVRVVLIAVVGAALGFALAAIGRHTAMALGVGIAYLIAYELGTLIIFNMIGTEFPERFRLSTYVVAWLTKRYEFTERSFTCDDTGCFGAQRYVVTWVEAGAVLAGVALALVAGAFFSMRRRDVA
jgi:hypothetical protein